MKAQFKEGDFVFYFRPGHQFHMMMFQLQSIYPIFLDPNTGLCTKQEYFLVYGSRSVTATYEELLHRNDPQVRGELLRQANQSYYLPYGGEVATGMELERIGHLYGISRHYGESDSDFRNRIKQTHPLMREAKTNPHDGHEVVENWAGGKSFMYCRHCKVEVA